MHVCAVESRIDNEGRTMITPSEFAMRRRSPSKHGHSLLGNAPHGKRGGERIFEYCIIYCSVRRIGVHYLKEEGGYRK